MYTLGIPNRQKRRTLGYLKQNWVNFEVNPSMDGFFDLHFPELDEDSFKDIVNRLKQQGVTIIGADSQLTERKIMKLTKLLSEQEDSTPYKLENDPTSQGFESNAAEDIIIDLKRTLETWRTKKYASAEDRYMEYALDIEELVDEYESGMGSDQKDRDDEFAMHKTMMDAPVSMDLQEQKIRNKIKKEINKLLSK
jgi:hypothetical protein